MPGAGQTPLCRRSCGRWPWRSRWCSAPGTRPCRCAPSLNIRGRRWAPTRPHLAQSAPGCSAGCSACAAERGRAPRQVLLAANLRDAEALLPHFILQLLQLLAVLPRDAAFLSIYESGSSDATGASRCCACTLLL